MMVKIIPPRIFTLVLLTGVSVLSLNMFVTSLANIANEFGSSYSTVNLAIAGYLAITVIVQLIAGPLSDRIGRRPVVLISIILFTCASIICAVAENVWVFLIFRLVQSAIASGYALSIVMIRDTTTDQKTAGIISYISMSMALAPMLGPMLGGVLDFMYGWRANFYFYAAMGLFLLTICWFDLKETLPSKSSRTSQKEGSFLELLFDPRFLGYSFCSAFSTGAFYVFIAGASFVGQKVFNIATSELGIYVGSITMGFIVGAFLSNKLVKRYEFTTIMLIGRIVACGGLLVGILILIFGFQSPITFFGCTIFVGLGNGLTTPSSNTGAISIKPNLSGSAAGINGAITVATGSIFTLFTGYLLVESTATYMLLSIMLLSSFLGLIAVLWIIYKDQKKYSPNLNDSLGRNS